VEIPVLDAEEDRTEHAHEPSPGAEAPRHRVRIRAVVRLELLEEGEQREVLRVERMLHGEQPSVFGVEHEHEPQEDGEEPLVEVVSAARERVIEQIAPVAFGRRLEAAEEDLQRFEDLVGQIVRDVRLPLPALGEDRGQRAFLGDAEEAVRREQHHERVEDRTAADADHVLDSERDRARRLSVRRVDQAHGLAVREETYRHAAMPEQPVELRGRRILPRARRGLGPVEIEPGG